MALVKRLAALCAAFFVPIAIALAASQQLPVPSVTIYPGDVIAGGMLTLGDFPAGTAENLAVAGSAEELVGKVARRTLLPGRLIARNAVSVPMVVQKGTIVPAVYRHGELTITASVLALQSGALGEVIQVRNIDSGKTIVGAVRPDGSIAVGAGR
jgi:flagella basal body P-ring formation protein FlgA